MDARPMLRIGCSREFGEGRGEESDVCNQSKKKKNHSVSAKHLACCQAILGVREVIWEN